MDGYKVLLYTSHSSWEDETFISDLETEILKIAYVFILQTMEQISKIKARAPI